MFNIISNVRFCEISQDILNVIWLKLQIWSHQYPPPPPPPKKKKKKKNVQLLNHTTHLSNGFAAENGENIGTWALSCWEDLALVQAF